MKAIVVGSLLIASQSRADGVRELRDDMGRCLDATAQRVVVHRCQGLPSQQWQATPASNGFVKLSPGGSPGMCLEVDDQGGLRLAKCGNGRNQTWKERRRTPTAIRLTTEARGEAQCLAISSDAPRLVECSEGRNAWTAVETETQEEANEREDSFDGEIQNSHASKFDFVLDFDAACKLAIPGQAPNAVRILRCRRKEGDIRCTIRSATTAREIYASLPSLKELRAPISKDTPQLIAFATPKGKFAFKANPQSATVTLVQQGASTCTGHYMTYADFRAKADQYHAEHPVPRSVRDDDNETTREVAPRPSLGRRTKSRRGDMCGKPSDCESGSCKMENKTRGRCQ